MLACGASEYGGDDGGGEGGRERPGDRDCSAPVDLGPGGEVGSEGCCCEGCEGRVGREETGCEGCCCYEGESGAGEGEADCCCAHAAGAEVGGFCVDAFPACVEGLAGVVHAAAEHVAAEEHACAEVSVAELFCDGDVFEQFVFDECVSAVVEVGRCADEDELAVGEGAGSGGVFCGVGPFGGVLAHELEARDWLEGAFPPGVGVELAVDAEEVEIVLPGVGDGGLGEPWIKAGVGVGEEEVVGR